MKALVVYESMFGNTERVARAIAAGLGEHLDVEVREVQEAFGRPGNDVDLVVAGGPTHAFSMTRASTRLDAIRQGAMHGSSAVGLREWIQRLPRRTDGRIATFDTRISKVRHLPGSAAASAARVARGRGYRAVTHGESFYVDDLTGPLMDGELARAREWGRTVAARVSLVAGAR